jgi:hypothetical protein
MVCLFRQPEDASIEKERIVTARSLQNSIPILVL